MEFHSDLKRQLKETYVNTLTLAKSISKNHAQYFDHGVKQSDVHFLKKISKGYKEFADLTSKYVKPKTTQNFKSQLTTTHKKPKILSPKSSLTPSSKERIETIADESYKLACRSKSGFGGIRYLTPSPLPVFEKLKNNKSAISENPETSFMSYYSLVNGKSEKIELPSFKECIKGNCRVESQSQNTLMKFQNCEQKLVEFERKLNGLENYIKMSPGTAWSPDKRMYAKYAILGTVQNGLRGMSDKKLMISNSIDSRRKSDNRLRRTTLLVDPRLAMMAVEEVAKKKKKIVATDKDLAERFEGFYKAKKNADEKMTEILEKIQVERPVYLRSRANLIISDKEVYKGRIHSFRKLNEMKKIVEHGRYENMKICKKQVQLYINMLDYLKRYKGMPKPCMISFVEAIRELLQGGWKLERSLIDEIYNTYSVEDQADLHELLEIFDKFT